MIGEGLDVMSMERQSPFPAFLAGRPIAGEDGSRPRPMLASPVLPAAINLVQRVRLTGQSWLTVLGAFHRAELPSPKVRDGLVIPLAERLAAVLAGKRSRLWQVARIIGP
jgi:hypothetical protein